MPVAGRQCTACYVYVFLELRYKLYTLIYVMTLHVEYAGGGIKYGILFRFSLFYEYSILEYIFMSYTGLARRYM